MELSWLKYFRVLARVENMTKAAAELYITQPTLSQTIAKLENELGVKLFTRANNRITLNHYGEMFLRDVDRILMDLDRSVSEFQMLKNTENGFVSLGVSTPRITRGFLSEFSMAYPSIRLRTFVYSNEQMLDALKSHKIDLAFSFTSQETTFVTGYPLYREQYIIVCNRHHPLLDGAPHKLSEFKNERFLLNSINSDESRNFISCCIQAGFSPDILFEGHEVETISDLVQRGLGVYIVSLNFENEKLMDEQKFISGTIARNGNQIIKLSDAFCTRKCSVYRLQKGTLSPSAELFLRSLLNYFNLSAKSLNGTTTGSSL